MSSIRTEASFSVLVFVVVVVVFVVTALAFADLVFAFIFDTEKSYIKHLMGGSINTRMGFHPGPQN